MSNEEYMKLYKQFQPMLIKIVTKWSKLNIIEYDDLMQYALLELIHAAKTFDKTKGTKFSTYVYDMIEYRLRREIQKVREKNKIKTISINSTIEAKEGDTVTLLDLIADDTDYFEKVNDAIMVQTYKDEAKRVLPKDKYDICALKWFHNYSYEAIERVLGAKNISGILMNSRMALVRKSALYRNEYYKLRNISEFSNAAKVII